MDDGLVQTVLHQVPHQDRTVLILVVVDDGLVRRPIVATRAVSQVLILVVVDDGLVRVLKISDLADRIVLILVVVDDGLVPYFLIYY